MQDVGVAIASGLGGGSSSAGASSVGDSLVELVVAVGTPFTDTCAFVAGEIGVYDKSNICTWKVLCSGQSWTAPRKEAARVLVAARVNVLPRSS